MCRRLGRIGIHDLVTIQDATPTHTYAFVGSGGAATEPDAVVHAVAVDDVADVATGKVEAEAAVEGAATDEAGGPRTTAAILPLKDIATQVVGSCKAR